MANELREVFSTILQQQGAATFTAKFSELPVDTLKYLDRIDRYIKVHNLKDEGLKFQKIFTTLSVGIRERFFVDNKDTARLTIKILRAWLLKNYPPPFNKYHFERNVNTMIIRKNEDPKVVYDRFFARVAKINAAIDIMNESVDVEEQKMEHLRDEFWINALQGIFIRRNNNAKYKNKGTLNRELFNRIKKEDPRTLGDWKGILENITTDLVPFCLQGHHDYKWIHYPADGTEYDIYSGFKMHQSTNSNSNIVADECKDAKKISVDHQMVGGRASPAQRGKVFQSVGFVGSGSRGRGRGQSIGIKRSYPFQNQQQYLDKNGQPMHCTRCGRKNHITDDCIAKYHRNKTYLGPVRGRGRSRNHGPGHFRHHRSPSSLRTCFHCGSADHFAAYCPSKNSTNSTNNCTPNINKNTLQPQQQPLAKHCRRCTRADHVAQDCLETTYPNGEPINAKTMAAIHRNPYAPTTDPNASNDNGIDPVSEYFDIANIDEVESRQSKEFRKIKHGQIQKLLSALALTNNLTESQKEAVNKSMMPLAKILFPNGYTK